MRKKERIRVGTLGVLLAAGLVFSLWSMRTRSAAMLLPDSDSLDGVSLTYNSIVDGTPSGPALS
ncbi:hypothetical protein SDC9_143791 [bioreactor metagenome]|uniref:Uncharacterized protein n=1 Tax=bioreactor metagenome TaxID=1076179 RepID=A0A645E547_9ZZZZ